MLPKRTQQQRPAPIPSVTPASTFCWTGENIGRAYLFFETAVFRNNDQSLRVPMGVPTLVVPLNRSVRKTASGNIVTFEIESMSIQQTVSKDSAE